MCFFTILAEYFPLFVMKILHTADWHLGQTFYGFDRGKEHACFLDWLCGIAKERSADVLLIAGDVFDSPNPSAEAQRMFYHFLTRITNENPEMQIVVTAGNHDSAARLEAPNPLLKVFNVSVSGIVHYTDGEIDYERMIVPLKGGGCCLAVPYLRHNDYPAADSYSQGVAMLYNELYTRASAQGYFPIIAMGHLQASGAEVSVGDASEHMIIGGMEGIDARFAGNGIVYTALGHLHKAQKVAHHENIRYSGAPLPMSFAERRNTQSITQVTIDNSGNCTVEKIAFDTPVKLLSVPTTPQPIDTVLEELKSLPDGKAGEFAPFLEVKVLVTAVEMDMRRRIEETIEGKNVRLARIEAVSNMENSENGAPVTYEDFKNIRPEELIKEIYKKNSGEEMSQDIMSLLNDVINEVVR